MQFQSPRTFRLWRYGVGHSQLLLRATPEGADTTRLDLRFEGVTAIQLGTRYVAPELRLADRGERDALRKLAQPGLTGPRHVAIAIESETGSGLVLCGRVSALRGGSDPVGGTENSEILWSHPPAKFWRAPLSEAVWAELSDPALGAITRCDEERLELERSRMAPRLRSALTVPIYSMAHRFIYWERLVRRLEPDREAAREADWQSDKSTYSISAYGNDLESRDAIETAMAKLPREGHEGPLGKLLATLDARFTAATTPDPQGTLRPWVHPPKNHPEADLGMWWQRRPIREPWN